MAKVNRSTEEYIVLSLSGASLLSLIPLAVIRLLQSDWAIATLDVLAIISISFIFFYVLITHKAKMAANVLAFFCFSILVISLYLKGAGQLYWVYPSLVAFFFILPPRTAAIFVVLFLITLLPFVISTLDLVLFIAFYMSIIMTTAFSFFFSYRMREQQLQLQQLVSKDALTGAGNRLAMEGKLRTIVELRHGVSSDASLILFDLDEFKKVNDRFGHVEGDKILQQVKTVISQRIRATDSLYRLGGEEFVVIVENSSLNASAKLAEELRSSIENCSILQKYNTTISLGTAQYKAGETVSEWLERADKAMYAAKSMGRNMSCVA